MTAKALSDDALISLDELTERTGISVRNVRFYTTRGLVSPPVRRGRSGYYTPDHVARLELVKELQAHGFTLAAIERYVARIPEGSTPEEIAVHRVTLQPWLVEEPEMLTRRQLDERAGRPLSQEAIERLVAMAVVQRVGHGRFAVHASRFASAIGLVELDVDAEMLSACNQIFTRHARSIAEELLEVFQQMVWPAYRGGALPAEQLVRLLEAFQPTSVAALVEALNQAMTDVRRAEAARRTT